MKALDEIFLTVQRAEGNDAHEQRYERMSERQKSGINLGFENFLSSDSLIIAIILFSDASF